jgi:Peptidase family M23
MFYKILFCIIIFAASALLSCGDMGNGIDLLDSSEVYKQGHKFTNWFYSNKLDSLITRFIDKDYTLQNLREFRERVWRQLGEELNLLNEQFYVFWFEEKHIYGYIRYSEFSKVKQPIYTGFGFDKNGSIYRFEVQTLPGEAPTKYSNYQTKTELRLPFEGEWHVAWGGRTINYNNHATAPDQRFAYDFLIKKDEYSFRKDGLNNKDYYCFNKKIFTPGDGNIVDVENSLQDNKVGDMPEVSGNRVIIDHHNGEFSVLSHFRHESIVVTVGDTVKSGQFLGYCGNSGHSSEPHLHYHLQNTPVMFEGEGLPAQFQNYEADGQAVARGEPFWNQQVKQIN